MSSQLATPAGSSPTTEYGILSSGEPITESVNKYLMQEVTDGRLTMHSFKTSGKPPADSKVVAFLSRSSVILLDPHVKEKLGAAKTLAISYLKKTIGAIPGLTEGLVGSALDLLDIVLPILIDYGPLAAKGVVAAIAPEAAPKILPILDKVAEVMTKINREFALPAVAKAKSEAHKLFVGKGEYYRVLRQGGYQGGAETVEQILEGHDLGSLSRTKEAVIDQIIDAFGKLGWKASGKDRAEKVKSILSHLPKSFVSNTQDQIKACQAVAKVLAEKGLYKDDPSLPPEVTCQNVVEIVASLASGMHAEFLAVYADIAATIRNLKILRGLLEMSAQEMKNKYGTNTDLTASAEFLKFFDIHKLLLQKIDEQIGVMQNLVNISVDPADASLASLLKGVGVVVGNVKKLDYKYGTDAFGRFIAQTIQSMGVTALVGVIVNQALKTIGMSMKEYKEISKSKNNIGELYRRFEELRRNKPGFDDETYVNAVELLVKYLSKADKIEEVSGANELPDNILGAGDCPCGCDSVCTCPSDCTCKAKKGSFEGSCCGAYEGSYAGGDDEPLSAMEKRIKKRKAVRDLIMDAFYTRIDQIDKSIIAALENLSRKVGTEIPISPELETFRRVLQRLKEEFIHNKDIYYALIGYYRDALSKSKKDQFISNLKMINSQIESIASLDLYKSSAQYFHAVRDAINSLISVIDKYTDEVSAKYGSDEFEGGYNGGDDFKAVPKYKSTKGFVDAIRQFDYYYRVAQIKANLAKSATEIKSYSTEYERLNAETIAGHLNAAKKKIDELTNPLAGGAVVGTDEPAGRLAADPGNALNAALGSGLTMSEEKTHALKLKDKIWDTKKKFWSVIEAIDTYLRHFTDGIVNDIEAVRDIKSMLEKTEVLDRFYDESSGNTLYDIFNLFPTAAKVNTVPSKTVTSTEKHPYETLTDATVLGNPFVGMYPSVGTKLISGTQAALKLGNPLKNLLSLFFNMGSKFGGVELTKKTFLSPAQIYNILIEYLSVSAFTIGRHVDDNYTGYDTYISAPVDLSAADLADVPTHQLSLMPFDNAGARNAAARPILQNVGVRMRSHHFPADVQGLEFKQEDDYFVHLIKAICAKVFTVVGLADVFHRPAEFNGINNVRMILGGDDDLPRIDDAAVELYIRLPLLAYFYKEFFHFEKEKTTFGETVSGLGKSGQQDSRIVLVPDIEGTFAGLIRMIFRDIRSVKDIVSLSVEDIKRLVSEVNLIYSKMKEKYPQNTSEEIIREFVAEINRRYGVVSQDERNKYEEEFGYRYGYNPDISYANPTKDRYAQPSEAVREYPLLEGEGDRQTMRQASFASLLRSTVSDKEIEKYRKIHESHYKLLSKFRCALDRAFASPDEEFTFREAIKNTKNKLKAESRPDKRFELVASMMRGVDVYSKYDDSKYFVFHETVVAGLNVLSAIHTILTEFSYRVHLIDVDLIWNLMIDDFHEVSKNIAHNVIGARTIGDVADALMDKLTSMRILPGDNAHYFATKLQSLLGHGEAYQEVGGYMTVVPGDHRAYALRPETGTTADPTTANYIARAVTDTRLVNLTTAPADGGTVGFNRNGTQEAGSNKAVFGRGQAVNNTPAAKDHPSLYGLLEGFRVAEAKAVNDDPKLMESTELGKRLQFVKYYAFNRQYAMQQLIELLYSISQDTQGLIKVTIKDGRIDFSYSELYKLVQQVFENVNYCVETLRPHIKESILENYLSKDRPGTLYWLKEQLIEKLFVGREAELAGVASVRHTSAAPRLRYPNLDSLVRSLNSTYRWCIGGTPYSQAHIGLAGGAAASPQLPAPLPLGQHKKNSFAHLFADMIYYDSTRPGSGIYPTREANSVDAADGANSGPVLFDPAKNPLDELLFKDVGSERKLDTRFILRFQQFYAWSNTPEINSNRSTLFVFNQLVARYLEQFYDPISKKIYKNLIDKFINGAFNKAVTNFLYTYPDVTPVLFYRDETALGEMELLETLAKSSRLTDAMIEMIMYDIKYQRAAARDRGVVTGGARASPFDNGAGAGAGRRIAYVLRRGAHNDDYDLRKGQDGEDDAAISITVTPGQTDRDPAADQAYTDAARAPFSDETKLYVFDSRDGIKVSGDALVFLASLVAHGLYDIYSDLTVNISPLAAPADRTVGGWRDKIYGNSRYFVPPKLLRDRWLLADRIARQPSGNILVTDEEDAVYDATRADELFYMMFYDTGRQGGTAFHPTATLYDHYEWQDWFTPKLRARELALLAVPWLTAADVQRCINQNNLDIKNIVDPHSINAAVTDAGAPYDTRRTFIEPIITGLNSYTAIAAVWNSYILELRRDTGFDTGDEAALAAIFDKFVAEFYRRAFGDAIANWLEATAIEPGYAANGAINTYDGLKKWWAAGVGKYTIAGFLGLITEIRLGTALAGLSVQGSVTAANSFGYNSIFRTGGAGAGFVAVPDTRPITGIDDTGALPNFNVATPGHLEILWLAAVNVLGRPSHTLDAAGYLSAGAFAAPLDLAGSRLAARMEHGITMLTLSATRDNLAMRNALRGIRDDGGGNFEASQAKESLAWVRLTQGLAGNDVLRIVPTAIATYDFGNNAGYAAANATTPGILDSLAWVFILQMRRTERLGLTPVNDRAVGTVRMAGGNVYATAGASSVLTSRTFNEIMRCYKHNYTTADVLERKHFVAAMLEGSLDDIAARVSAVIPLQYDGIDAVKWLTINNRYRLNRAWNAPANKYEALITAVVAGDRDCVGGRINGANNDTIINVNLVFPYINPALMSLILEAYPRFERTAAGSLIKNFIANNSIADFHKVAVGLMGELGSLRDGAPAVKLSKMKKYIIGMASALAKGNITKRGLESVLKSFASTKPKKKEIKYSISDGEYNSAQLLGLNPNPISSGCFVTAREEAFDPVPANSINQTGFVIPNGTAPGTYEYANIIKLRRRIDPDENHVLLTSLSIILRNMYNSRVKAGAEPYYLINNIADVPEHMREKYRAQLPLFRALFKSLMDRCLLLKTFVDNPDISFVWDTTKVKYGDDRNNALINYNPWPYQLLPVTATGKEVRDRLGGILGTIINGSSAMITTCEQVLQELGDVPKTLELYSGMIKHHKQVYDQEPLLPISTVLHQLKNTDENSLRELLPFVSNGESAFKLQFATRAALATHDASAGTQINTTYLQCIDEFNKMSDKKDQITMDKIEKLHEAIIKLSRYVHGIKVIKNVLSSQVMFTNDSRFGHVWEHNNAKALRKNVRLGQTDLVVTETNLGGAPPSAGADYYNATHRVPSTNRSPVSMYDLDSATLNNFKLNPSSFGLVSNLASVTQTIENGDRSNSLQKIVRHLVGKSPSAAKILVQNIIDLNIIPINVHGLMRDIPLSNLLNYSYTFDKMTVDLLYGVNTLVGNKMLKDLCDSTTPPSAIKSQKDALLRIILQPHCKVNDFRNKFLDTLRMTPGIEGLGRPKFISDQLLGKALLGNVYRNASSASENGPGYEGSRSYHHAVMMLMQIIAVFMRRAIRGVNTLRIGAGGITVRFLALIYDTIISNEYLEPSKLKAILVDTIKPLFSTGTPAQRTVGATYVASFVYVVYNMSKLAIKMALTTDDAAVRKQTIFMHAFLTDFFFMLKGADAATAYQDTISNFAPPTTAAHVADLANNAALVAWAPGGGASIFEPYPAAATAQPDTYVVHNGVHANYNAQGVDQTAPFKFSGPGFLGFMKNLVAFNGADTRDVDAGTHPEVHAVVRTDNVRARDMSLNRDESFLDGLVSNLSDIQEKVALGLSYIKVPSTKDYEEPDLNADYPDNVNNAVAQIASAQLSDNKLQEIHTLSCARTDTVLMRNLIFLSNVYRIVRLKLNRELNYTKDIIAKAEPITRSTLTEFYGNSIQSEPSYKTSKRYKSYT